MRYRKGWVLTKDPLVPICFMLHEHRSLYVTVSMILYHNYLPFYPARSKLSASMRTRTIPIHLCYIYIGPSTCVAMEALENINKLLTTHKEYYH